MLSMLVIFPHSDLRKDPGEGAGRNQNHILIQTNQNIENGFQFFQRLHPGLVCSFIHFIAWSSFSWCPYSSLNGTMTVWFINKVAEQKYISKAELLSRYLWACVHHEAGSPSSGGRSFQCYKCPGGLMINPSWGLIQKWPTRGNKVPDGSPWS